MTLTNVKRALFTVAGVATLIATMAPRGVH